MDAAFWHQKWKNHEIGFHQDKVNPYLIDYFDALSLAPGQRVFVPLCGKTLDIGWLIAKSHQVVGVEIDESAVKALFKQLAVTPDISKQAKLIKYSYQQLVIFVGDIFDLTQADLGKVDAIYDRAAIVALPKLSRIDYVKHVQSITQNASQLLINYEYDQSAIAGPPFSVPTDELKQHFQDRYTLKQLHHGTVDGGMKGKTQAWENVWLLKRK